MPTIDGPNGPIAYERDPQGFPRVRARDLLEGTYARGYLHATDRLVQVHVWQLAGHGRLMEVLGDVPLARATDQGVRALDLGSDLAAQVEALAPETRRWLEAYCEGFNAGAARRGRPLLLRLLGIPLLRHSPQSVLLLYRTMSYVGLTSQLHLARAALAELAAQQVSPRFLQLLVGDGVEGADLDAVCELQLSQAFRALAPAGALAAGAGSNAFAVSGARSASGGALLMGEFHLEVGRFPPVPYFVHIDYADDEQHGGYYQGVGLAGVPWLQAGRTRHVAWTYTFGRADNFEVLVERCQNGRCLTAAGAWQPARRREERVAIRGRRRPERWVYYDSDCGAIVGDARTTGDYPCLRWSGLRHTWRDLDAVHASFGCRDVAGMVACHRELRMMSLGAALADAEGQVALVHSGQVDQRPADSWRSVLPRAGWKLAVRPPEPLPEAARPVDLAPADGCVVTANERPPGPAGERWCRLPEPRYRHDRLLEILQGAGDVDLVDMVRSSYDGVDLCAARLVPVWHPLLPPGVAAERAAALRDWASSQTPWPDADARQQLGLFHALHHEVLRALLEPQLGQARTRALLVGLAAGITFQHHLDAALALERSDLLDARTLRQLLARAWPPALFAADSGRFWAPVRARFVHFAAEHLPPVFGLATPPYDLPGGPVSPFQTRVVDYQGQRMVIAPAFHLLFDMSAPGGWYNMPGGASERLLGPGHGAGIDGWLAGRFLPLGDPQGDPPDLCADSRPIGVSPTSSRKRVPPLALRNRPGRSSAASV